MDRSSVQRGALKRNFLKEIIMRLDFQGVLQAEMEKVLLKAKPFLKEHNFNRYSEDVQNEIITNNNDQNVGGQVGIKDVKAQVVYTFTSESAGYSLKLSNTSIILVVSSQGYAPFDDYSNIFCNIATMYRDKIDFFTPKRFGLRKINILLLNMGVDINQYFSSSFFNREEPIEHFETQRSRRQDNLSDGIKHINISFQTDKGNASGVPVTQAVLDSDIYLETQKEIEQTIFDIVQLNQINDILFKIYINSVTEEFLDLLTNEDETIPEGVIGVENNG